jgi:hypothetical protein
MMHKSRILRLLLICYGIVFSNISCTQRQQIQTNEEDTSIPSFVIQGSPHNCDCISLSERFINAELRLDPTKRDDDWQKPNELLDLLKSRIEQSGSEIIIRNVNDCLEELASRTEPGPANLTILVHPHGHFYLLLGTVMIGDVLTYQIVHGDSAIWLIDKSSLEKAQFETAWQFKHKIESIPVQIGESVLELSNHYFNFGKVLPVEKLEHIFYLKNIGTKSLIFHKPEVTCRCTATDDLANTELQPKESKEFKVSFTTSTAVSERHSVFLPIFEKGSGQSKRLEFLLLASQQQSMQIEPMMIDFGNVIAGEKYTRTINLTEVPTDRFSITKIDSNSKPIKGSFNTIGIHQGLKTYQAEILFSPNDKESEPLNDFFVIETNSILRPNIPIYYTYKLLSDISAKPSTISLGSVAIGETVEEKITITSRKHEIINCRIQKVPDNCNAEIVRQGNPTELLVRIKPNKSGIWQDKIFVVVKTSLREEVLEIDCVGYVH